MSQRARRSRRSAFSRSTPAGPYLPSLSSTSANQRMLCTYFRALRRLRTMSGTLPAPSVGIHEKG